MTKDQEHFLSCEEEFHGNDRKLSRSERKQAIKQDRSQYKKTDLDKQKKKEVLVEEVSKTALRGRVLGIYSEGIQVEVSGVSYRCQIKGSLKKGKQETKNLVAVGDFVFFEPVEGSNLIFRVEPRRSILSRADNLLRRKEQLIAVNIDQVIITASILSPSLKPFLLDRYIIASQKGNMDPIIVINKIDLLETEEDKELVDLCQKVYEDLGIPFLRVSVHTGEGISELKKKMQGKSSVFSGQSGAGTSSLINAVTGSALKVGDVVAKTDKGSHTTTTSKLIPIEGEGFCVDTPGIKSFGVWDLVASEIEHYFVEIKEASLRCKFPGCGHQSEPNCSVKEAIEKGEISPIRLASYFALLDTLQQKHRTR